MGKNNSSITRVQPLMNSFLQIKYNRELIVKLLDLMENGLVVNPFKEKSEDIIGEIKAVNYLDEKIGIIERGLPPSSERLIWLVENLKDASKGKNIKNDGSSTDKKRKKLIENDKTVIQEGKNEILQYDRKEKWPNKWWVLEGNTYPDIFIETDKFIFVGEAKRTENNLTTSTTWDTERVQLVRHVEGALNYSKNNLVNGKVRPVFSFYIIDESKIKNYIKDLELTQNGDVKTWENSLKHLVNNENEDITNIKNSYIGYTTWEIISKKLNIKFDS